MVICRYSEGWRDAIDCAIIDDLGEKPGAVGWSNTSDRPELIAEFVTACYVHSNLSLNLEESVALIGPHHISEGG